MRRLLEDVDRLFDIRHEIDGVPLREILEETIATLEANVLPDWGTPGDPEVAVRKARESVRFRYLPHLFPEMELKLRLAHMLQFHLLPRDPPPGSPVTVSAVLESYCHLSGDLFGWEMLRDGRFLIWIVDVSGHGVRSGLASAILNVIIANVGERGDLARLVGRLNEALCACLRRDGAPVFATGFFAVIAGDGSVDYTSAGHPPAMVRGQDASVRPLRSNSRPIGMLEESTYAVEQARLRKSELLVLATDGLFEMTGENGEEFGEHRLSAFLASRPFRRTTELSEALYRLSGEYQDLEKLDDDLSFVVARVE